MINDLNRYFENIDKTLKANDINKIKNSTVLITGANGLIGSCIVDILEYLNKKENGNIKIIALIRNKNRINPRFKEYENIEYIEQDVTKEITLKEKIDYIIHAASNAHPTSFSTDPVGTILGNIMGMNNILNLAVNSKCKRVLYVSSGEIYGQSDNENERFNENFIGKQDSLIARNCYPISKKAAENLCVSFSQQFNIDTVIVRPCHCYGPTQTEEDSRASAQFIREALKGNNIVLKSEGKPVRSYCYVVDCAIGLIMALLNGESGDAYNIANNNAVVSIKEFATIVSEKVGKKVVFELPDEIEKRGYNPVNRSVLDGSKLEKIGWKPCWNVKEGINETIEIMR